MRNPIIAITLGVLSITQQDAGAAVECRMPNGTVIELKMASKCPAGSIGGKTPKLGTVPKHGQPKLKREGRNGHLAQVNQTQFGERWPFIVEDGVLACMRPLAAPDLKAVYFVHAEVAYPINGTAQTLSNTEKIGRLNDIWREDRTAQGTRIPITAVLNAGLSLCEYSDSDAKP